MEVEDNHVEDPSTMESMVKRSLLARNRLAIIIKGSDGEVQYCCVQCPTRCTDKKNLENHLYTHNNEYRYLCGICGTGLKRKEHLERHTLEHLQVRPHICDVCSKAFKRKEHLNIHRSIHSGDKTEVCMLCSKCDFGYPLRTTLMTSIVDAEPKSPESYYTNLHCRVRNMVERCVGVLM